MVATIVGRRSVIRLVVAGTAAAAFSTRRSSAQSGMPGSSVYPVAVPLYQLQYVAMGRGFLRDEGLDFKLLQGGSGTKSREILAAGQADFAIGDVTHSLQLSNRGRRSRILSAVDTRVTGGLLSRKDLYDSGLDDVRKVASWLRPDGSKPIFGVSSLGGTSHVWADYFTDSMGIKDKFAWVGAGNVETMLGALKTKQIDLLGASASMIQEAEIRGWGKNIFALGAPENWDRMIGGNVPVTANFTLQSTIDRDPAKVQAYVNALYRAGQWIKTSSAAEIYGIVEPYVGSMSRDANLIEIEAYKSAADYDGIIDDTSFKCGAKVWFRDMTGIKPIAREDAVADVFIRAAKKKYG
jgi:NitT/TauT family transport system substrate-binding protein